MKQKCLACGVEKDMEFQEIYPYTGDRIVIGGPMEPLLTIECAGDVDWRNATLCHACIHKLDPDLWISEACWLTLNPITSFDQLPLLESPVAVPQFVNPSTRTTSDVRVLAAEIVNAARALAQREVPFVDGVRHLAGLRFSADRYHDPDFRLLVAIDSESNHLPSQMNRGLCSESWLARCDAEAEELEHRYGESIGAACARLIGRFAAVA
jgi:hypothetical protein